MKLSLAAVLLAICAGSGLISAAPAGTSTVYLPGLLTPVKYGTARVETPFTSVSKDTFVKQSVVSLFVPIKTPTAHLPECDYISYIRYRHADGPSDPLKADRVETFMPGTLAGASSADQLARNVIFYAKEKHNLNVEFWALDRRANCLDDQTGVFAAVQGKNLKTGFDYYYNKAAIAGRKFAGFYSNTDANTAILAELGVEQTSSDWYDVVTRELPDANYRATKHYASGHSLGGPLTAFFAAYDRDGDVKTTGDAGYNQAAGFIGYDTVVTTKFGPANIPEGLAKIIQPIIDAGFEVAQAGFRSGILPRSLLTALPVVLNSETTQLLSLVGGRAVVAPKAEADVKGLPRTPTITSAAQFFFSKTVAQFATFFPSAFNLRATNEALVGAILSDRSQGFAFLQASVGFGTGGKIEERSFPVGASPFALPSNESQAASMLPLSSPYPLGVPSDAGFLGQGNGPLYEWLDYDQIKEDGSNVDKANNGQPFTKAKFEVSSISDLSRSLSEAPLDFTEHYYATRTTTDVLFQNLGSKNVMPKALHLDGYTKRPILNVVGSEGLAVGGQFGDLGNHVICDGYNHLDVLLANRKQTLGRQENSSIYSADFIAKVGSGVIA
ncbi:hypothetical protein IE81DRAFT_321963 [Ceraceosorus guamensis]|uniref:Alpha/beta-hydrolase n=1 Tax=Ceraceosorus guamensis TaxID=1522189 RepID=A0A316W803_9BASI|nr:hypothetical protein IE81DRAFT_321963 [Ceraceosorus guamensis]PWN43795.1 hypothetical protein IE81DRAFT_321963 [Ceraceosorus guamensis]